MNIYRMLKWASGPWVPGWLKMLELWAMHVVGGRYIGVFLDPVLACNLRCRMCLFSKAEAHPEPCPPLTDSMLEQIAKALFHRAAKLQIGCGAEPTLYPRLRRVVEAGRRAGVPFISLVTNGQLLADGRVDLGELADAGLSEITLSMHGTRAETYEHLMPGASFAKLLAALEQIRAVKQRHPHFKLRINFTINSMNVADLADDGFWHLWPEGLQPDVVQLRPVQQLGPSDWDDFNLEPLRSRYDDTIGAVTRRCAERGIICIAPSPHQLSDVATEQDSTSAMMEEMTYYYVSPRDCYHADFRLDLGDTFESYHRRHHTAAALLRAALLPWTRSGRRRHISKKLNYQVK